MYLFPFVKKRMQPLLRTLFIAAGILFLFSVIVHYTSRFTGLDAITKYPFSGAIVLYALFALIRLFLKPFEPAGFVGFNNRDLFIKNPDKSHNAEIPDSHIEQLLFKPGSSSDTYHWMAVFLGVLSVLIDGYKGSDSLLTVKTAEGASCFNLKFETGRQLEIFMNTLHNNPKVVILK